MYLRQFEVVRRVVQRNPDTLPLRRQRRAHLREVRGYEGHRAPRHTACQRMIVGLVILDCVYRGRENSEIDLVMLMI